MGIGIGGRGSLNYAKLRALRKCLPDGWGAEMRDIPKTIVRFFLLTEDYHPETGGKSLLAQ